MTPLQAPSQAAPSGVAVTASSVSSPNSVPNAPSVTASSVTSPNASVSSPSTVSSVSSPSASSSAVVVSSVTSPVSSVKPVGVTVKPLGYYDSSGTCVESATRTECKTSKELSDEADRLKAQARKAAGDAERERARLEAARIRAQIDMREAVGNDRTADGYVSRIENSALYKSLEGNPVGKTMFWLAISTKLEGKGWNEIYGSPRAFVEGVVRASETLVYKGRDSQGRMIFASAPANTGSSSLSNVNASAPPIPIHPAVVGAYIVIGGIALTPGIGGYLLEGIFNDVYEIFKSGIDMFRGLINAASDARDDPNSKLGTNKQDNGQVKRISKDVGLNPAQEDLLEAAITGTGASPEEIREIAEQIKRNFSGVSKGDRKRESNRR